MDNVDQTMSCDKDELKFREDSQSLLTASKSIGLVSVDIGRDRVNMVSANDESIFSQ